jgi:hypothetical protein
VHGTLSAATASETGTGTKVLRIKVDYDFVYVIEPPGKPAQWTRIIQQRYGWVDFARWDDPPCATARPTRKPHAPTPVTPATPVPDRKA